MPLNRTWTLPFLAMILLWLLPISGWAEPSARSLYRQGQAAEARQQYEEAFLAYRSAMQKSPADLRYRTACERVRLLSSALHLKRGNEYRQAGDTTDALAEYLRASSVDPSNAAVQQAIAGLAGIIPSQPEKSDLPQSPETNRKVAAMAKPVELKALSDDAITLHMIEDTRVIYQAIGKTAGVNVLFDPDLITKRVAVDITKIPLADALQVIGTLTGTFWRAITPNTIFVAADTRAKRTSLETQALQTFYLANTAQQSDANELITALRNVMDQSVRTFLVPSQNAIVMRGTPDQLLLAQKVIDDLDRAHAEVVIDVAVMTVSKDKVRNLGLQFPQSISGTLQSTSSDSNAKFNLNDMAHLNAKNIQLTVGSAAAQVLLTDSETRILQNPRLRATDGQKSTLKIGSRIPVATGSYSTPTAASSAAVQTQFTYIDVGVTMEMQPVIHYNGDVTLKVKVEISAKTGETTISGVTEPIISQQAVDEVIRLKEGESNLIGGLLEDQNNKDVSGTPGLGEVPLIKYLFSTQKQTLEHDEIVFLITPHLVRTVQVDPASLRQVDIGTGESIQLRKSHTE
ncbi:type II and III secretion system protein [Terriglobus albidus]|uniref:type II and III secretion system protein n=1 Tax=Terriglobus albidus TaxID=1592106 RepID=UPI0021E033E6|nr:type II and III secretion system protein [Terriglobus albidus]